MKASTTINTQLNSRVGRCDLSSLLDGCTCFSTNVPKLRPGPGDERLVRGVSHDTHLSDLLAPTVTTVVITTPRGAFAMVEDSDTINCLLLLLPYLLCEQDTKTMMRRVKRRLGWSHREIRFGFLAVNRRLHEVRLGSFGAVVTVFVLLLLLVMFVFCGIN